LYHLYASDGRVTNTELPAVQVITTTSSERHNKIIHVQGYTLVHTEEFLKRSI
jgi:hypothetical protein